MAASTIATNLILSCLAACALTAATGGWLPLLPGLGIAVLCTVVVARLSRAAAKVDAILRTELDPPVRPALRRTARGRIAGMVPIRR